MSRKVQIIDLQVQYESISGLENRLNQVNNELKQVKVGSDAFKALTTEAQNLNSALKDVNTQVEGITLDKKIMATDGVLKGFSGTISSVVGGLGLLGIESEKFGAFEQKAASAIAFGMGLKDVAEGFKQVKQSSILAEIATKLFGTTARAALLATGIGAFVVALGLVVTYFDDIKAALSGVTSEQTNLVKLQEEGVKAADDALDAISRTENILKLQGKTEGEILQMKKQATQEAIKEREKRLETTIEQTRAQAEIALRNKEILQGIIRFVTLPITALLAGIDLVGKAFGQNFNLEEQFSGGLAGLLFDPDAVRQAGDDTVRELETQLETLRNTSAGYDLKAKEDRAKVNEDKLKQAEDNANKLLELEKRLRDQVELLDKSEFDKRRILAQREFDETVKELDKTSQAYLNAQTILNATIAAIASDQAGLVAGNVQDILGTINTLYSDNLERMINSNLEGVVVVTQNAEGQLNSFTNDAIGRANFKFQQEIDSLVKLQATTLQRINETRQAIETGPDYPAREADLKRLSEAEIGIQTQTSQSIINIRRIQADTIKGIQDSEAAADKRLSEQVGQAKLDIAAKTIGAVGSFLKQGSAAAKSFAVAEASISTYSAANAAFKSAAASPITVLFPGYPALQAGLAVAFGLANVRKIIATRPGQGGLSANASARPGAGVGGFSPPQQLSIPPVPTQSIVSPVVRAYVLSGDVRNAQEADSRILRRRTL